MSKRAKPPLAQLSSEDLMKLAGMVPETPEAQAAITHMNQRVSEQVGPKPILRVIKSLNGTLLEAPIAWEGESLESFMARTGLSHGEATQMLYQAMHYEKNDPDAIAVVLATSYQQAVTP